MYVVEPLDMAERVEKETHEQRKQRGNEKPKRFLYLSYWEYSLENADLLNVQII